MSKLYMLYNKLQCIIHKTTRNISIVIVRYIINTNTRKKMFVTVNAIRKNNIHKRKITITYRN